MEVDGLSRDWVTGVDPSVTDRPLDSSRFFPQPGFDLGAADADVRASAQAAAAHADQFESCGFYPLPDGDVIEPDFESFRESLVHHFYYMKHVRKQISWKEPPPCLLDDLEDPRFICK